MLHHKQEKSKHIEELQQANVDSDRKCSFWLEVDLDKEYRILRSALLNTTTINRIFLNSKSIQVLRILFSGRHMIAVTELMKTSWPQGKLNKTGSLCYLKVLIQHWFISHIIYSKSTGQLIPRRANLFNMSLFQFYLILVKMN